MKLAYLTCLCKFQRIGVDDDRAKAGTAEKLDPQVKGREKEPGKEVKRWLIRR